MNKFLYIFQLYFGYEQASVFFFCPLSLIMPNAPIFLIFYPFLNKEGEYKFVCVCVYFM